MIAPAVLAFAVAAAAAPSSPSSAGEWEATLTVARCPYEPPALPGGAETALDATLLVRVGGGTGSAVLISPDGFALTAAHVVEQAESVDVVAHGGTTLRAQVVRVDARQDVALLKIDTEGPSSCLQPRAGQTTLGADIFILGSPGGEELSFSISKGIVSGYRSFGDMRFVQLDASVNPGNSGGPAVDAQGAIVGIASWKVSHVSMEGLAFAVPADVALQALGVLVGEQSSPDWLERKGRIEASGEVLPEPKPEPEPNAVSTAAKAPPRSDEPRFDAAQIRRTQLRRGFIIAGSILLGTGVTSIAVTGGVYRGVDRMTERSWQALQGVNTAGWALSIGGAAMVVTGLVIPRRIKDRTGVALTIQPGLQGASIHGSF